MKYCYVLLNVFIFNVVFSSTLPVGDEALMVNMDLCDKVKQLGKVAIVGLGPTEFQRISSTAENRSFLVSENVDFISKKTFISSDLQKLQQNRQRFFDVDLKTDSFEQFSDENRGQYNLVIVDGFISNGFLVQEFFQKIDMDKFDPITMFFGIGVGFLQKRFLLNLLKLVSVGGKIFFYNIFTSDQKNFSEQLSSFDFKPYNTEDLMPMLLGFNRRQQSPSFVAVKEKISAFEERYFEAKAKGEVFDYQELYAQFTKFFESFLLSHALKEEVHIDFTYSDSLEAETSRFSGISGQEEWGRWSEAILNEDGTIKDKLVSLTLNEEYGFPKKFLIQFKGHSYGSNTGKEMPVFLGGEYKHPITRRVITLKKQQVGTIHISDNGEIDQEIEINNDSLWSKANTLFFDVSEPQQPDNGDKRFLGIAFKDLRIIPVA